MKFINSKAWAVAQEQSKGTTNCLRAYKLACSKDILKDIVYWQVDCCLIIAVTFPALPAALLHTRVRNNCYVVD